MPHTPGPWNVGQYEWLIETGDDTEVAQATTANPQFRANAKLIATAPELIAALKALLAADDMDPRTWPTMCAASIATADAFALARAAIAKAEGK